MDQNPLFRAIFDNSLDAILIADDEGNYVDANPAACRMLGLRREELIGRNVTHFVPPEEQCQTGELWNRFRGDREQRGEIVLRSADGARRVLDYTAVAGVLPGVHVSVLRDVGGQRELERLRAEKSRREVLEAHEANRAKSAFIANMSHELRTPLNSILGFSELLRDPEQAPEDVERFHDAIARNGQRLLRLIDDILDLSRIEAGQMRVHPERFDLRELVGEVIEKKRKSTDEKGVTLRWAFKDDVPETVQTDPVRLRRVLSAVIGNAVKFTREGSIDVDVAKVGTSIAFDVKDTGTGIPPDLQARLFGRLAPGEATSGREHGGTGLGLILARDIAMVLGGNVELVESRPGLGSHFRVTAAATLDVAVPAREPMPPPPSKSLLNRRILLVEDSPDNQILLRRFLEGQGAAVDVAPDGKIALELWGDKKYDVILMDLQMPVLDGRSATRLLRMKGYTGPIIALTAHASASDRDAALSSGCTDFITKPIELKTLLSVVLKFL